MVDWVDRYRPPGDDEWSYPVPGRGEVAKQLENLRAAGKPTETVEKRLNQFDAAYPVWEENERAVRLFQKVQRQWIAGPSGAVGLNHVAVDVHIRRLRLDEMAEDQLWDDVILVESIVLFEWGKESERLRRELDRKRGRQ